MYSFTGIRGRTRFNELSQPRKRLFLIGLPTASCLLIQRMQYSIRRHELLAVGDLILTEVLQGFGNERHFNQARKLLTSLTVVELGGREIAIQAARNFRTLRSLGITVRKTVDTVIATRCIESRYDLLHSDRDFDPFTKHLGLRVVA